MRHLEINAIDSARWAPRDDAALRGFCPRHNIFGISFLDYGDTDYQNDPYFDSFGGYDMFRYHICEAWPPLRWKLGGDSFFSEEERIDVLEHLELGAAKASTHEAKADEDGDGRDYGSVDALEDTLSKYHFETLDSMMRAGFKPPDQVEKQIRQKRTEKATAGMYRFIGPQTEDFQHIRGVKEVLSGKYSGKPHWAVED
jgi:hypothetical protein